MLSSFTIENFKSYRGATLQLAPLTALVGANASGKSNAIEAMRLLSWMAAGDRLGSIRHALQEDRGIRGNVSDLACRGERAFFSLSCRTATGAALLRRRPNQPLRRRRGRKRLDPSTHGRGEEAAKAKGTGVRRYWCLQRRLGVFRW